MGPNSTLIIKPATHSLRAKDRQEHAFSSPRAGKHSLERRHFWKGLEQGRRRACAASVGTAGIVRPKDEEKVFLGVCSFAWTEGDTNEKHIPQ